MHRGGVVSMLGIMAYGHCDYSSSMIKLLCELDADEPLLFTDATCDSVIITT